MTPTTDANELGDMDLPSYGIRRILASLVNDPALKGATVELIDLEHSDADAYVEAIESLQPDLIGMSAYVWSTATLIEVARHIKKRRPSCMIVFGGPSARTAVFDLPCYPDPVECVDAIVSREGEVTFNQIARLDELTRTGLESIGGLDLPANNGWQNTGPRTPITRLDDIPSPYQLDLMRRESVAYLETYRGCPLSCTFCEWGASDSSTTVFSTEYLLREFEAYSRHQVPAVFLVDAGLNLNTKGFRNLYEAESQVGFLKSTGLWCEVYPSHVQDEHIQFLSEIGPSYLGIGLQSLDPDVLKLHQRPFNRATFESAVKQLSQVAETEVQIIFGLPGDSPEGFRRTLDFARSLPVAVRAYHCLVLPDALMTRGQPEWEMQFDPLTLEMQSCRGWSARELTSMRSRMTEAALASGGRAGDYWWFFPRLN
ncbi:MAG: radical SAM protein [Planctomycetaceae bacterium]|nr:radical SAM protein [Planctomycetales bacterium]MCB9924124.1 radical SAM protein [Planctomycetaceae bacterium]